MAEISVKDNDHDFAPLHETMQRYVDQEILAGVSAAVLVGQDLVDVHCTGMADREAGQALRYDHIFRAFSNTKLMVSCVVLLLLEEGHFRLDDPIEEFIPQLGERQVLRPSATEISDTEPANGPITIRHLLSHSSGLSNGFLDPSSLITQTYMSHQVNGRDTTLAEMMDILAELPLVFHPGTSWEYSVATDVLGRLVEILDGQPLDRALKARIFDPVGMLDTGFVVPPADRDRLTAFYVGANLMEPMKPGLTRAEVELLNINPLVSTPRLSAAGGLVTTLPDMVSMIQALLPGDGMLLRQETMALIKAPQVEKGICLRFPVRGDVPGKAYSAAGSVTLKPSSIDPPKSMGEVQWGGLGGTHWWILPHYNIAAVVMAHRVMSFWHPFSFELKRLTYEALLS